MGNKAFGEFVRSLREQRMFEDGDRLRQWTQEKLAEESEFVATAQIARIEQGKVENLRPFLEPLARAFGLSEGQKEHFYAAAGYVYVNEREPDRDEIREYFQELQFPAFARTPLWDFIAFNSYHCVLWGYTPEKLHELNSGKLGPNLLRVLFDPCFENEQYVGGPERWLANVRRSIQAFRFESFRHANSPRYRQIIGAMMSRYRDFAIQWQLTEPLTQDQSGHVTRPFATIFHPEFGPMTFLSLRTPQKYLGNSVDISVYAPLISSQENYQRLLERVKINEVLFFRHCAT
ncbi:MAG: helix-turn-helix domain-containing protein [Anaerolineae bacterium]|nr:helix-turn-helix domain-containing protein [Anaerolineae bacterium]